MSKKQKDDQILEEKGKAEETINEADLEKSVENSASSLEELEVLQNQLKKALADYMNLERSIDSRIEMRAIGIKKDIAAGLIEIMDDLKAAQELKGDLQTDEKTANWINGIMTSVEKIEKELGKLGVEKVELNVGDRFDSSLHEAIGIVYEGEDGSIHQIVQNAYVIGDLVVRPARVIVCKKPV